MSDNATERAQEIIKSGHTITAQQAEESGVGGSGSAFKDIRPPSEVTVEGTRKIKPLIQRQEEDENPLA